MELYPDGHCSYRGIVELMRDLLGVRISEGTIHNVHQAAARQAGAINRSVDLSPIRVGLHDEIFQGSQPVLAGVDAKSTYCYLLAAAEHRDADTWGIHLDATQQGLNPDYTIADAGQGLRAGQKAALGGKPCHGDVFHIQHQCKALANTLAGIAKGAKSRRKKVRKPRPGKHVRISTLPSGSRSPCRQKQERITGQRHPNAYRLACPRHPGVGRSEHGY